MKIVTYALFLATLLFSNLSQANMPVSMMVDPNFVGVKKIVILITSPLEISADIPHTIFYPDKYKSELTSHLIKQLKDKIGPDIEITTKHDFADNEVPDDVLVVRFWVTKKADKVANKDIILGAVTTTFYRNEIKGASFNDKAYGKFINSNFFAYQFQSPSISDFIKLLNAHLEKQIDYIAVKINNNGKSLVEYPL